MIGINVGSMSSPPASALLVLPPNGGSANEWNEKLRGEMDLKSIEIFEKIRDSYENPDFHENPRFLRESEIFAKIRDFRENPRFSRSLIFAKIQDFHENSRFSRKSQIFAKSQDFHGNPRFSRKSEIFE